jgi:hypothetical protein
MDNFDLKKYLAEGKLLKEEVDVNKILSDGGYDEVDDEELLATVKSRLKGKSNIGAKALNLLIMKIEDEEGGNIDFSEGKLLKEQQEDILSFLKNNKAELIQVLAKKYGFDEDDIEDHSEYEIRPGYDFDGNEDLEIAGLGESGLDFSFNPEKVKDEYGDASEFIINVGGKKIYGLAYNM